MKTFLIASFCLFNFAISAQIDEGLELRYLQSYQGPSNDYIKSIDFEESGAKVVTGEYYSSCNFDVGKSDFSLASGLSYSNIYILKYDKENKIDWYYTFGGESNDRSKDVTIDSQGNVYVVGTIYGTVAFERANLPDTTILAYADTSQNFLLKLDRFGNFDYLRFFNREHIVNLYLNRDDDPIIITGTHIHYLSSSGVTKKSLPFLSFYQNGISRSFMDANDNLYLLGSRHSGTGTDQATVIQKRDSSGTRMFERLVYPTGGFLSRLNGIATSDAGNVYITGVFGGTIDFNSSSSSTDTLSTPLKLGKYVPSNFLLKLDSNGRFLWVKKGIGEATSYFSNGNIAVDNSDNCWVVNQIREQTSISTLSGTKQLQVYNNGQSGAQTTSFAVKYNRDGKIEYANSFNNGSLTVSDVFIPKSSFNKGDYNSYDIWFTGTFNSTVDLRVQTGINGTLYGSTGDAYMAGYNMVQLISGINDNSMEDGIMAFPNPAHSKIWINGLNSSDNTDYRLYTISGGLVLEGKYDISGIDVSDLSGVYLLKLKSGGTETVRKVIISH